MLIAIFIMLTVLTLLKVAELAPQWQRRPPKEIRQEQRAVESVRIKNDLAQKKEDERQRELIRRVANYDGNLR